MNISDEDVNNFWIDLFIKLADEVKEFTPYHNWIPPDDCSHDFIRCDGSNRCNSCNIDLSKIIRLPT